MAEDYGKVEDVNNSNSNDDKPDVVVSQTQTDGGGNLENLKSSNGALWALVAVVTLGGLIYFLGGYGSGNDVAVDTAPNDNTAAQLAVVGAMNEQTKAIVALANKEADKPKSPYNEKTMAAIRSTEIPGNTWFMEAVIDDQIKDPGLRDVILAGYSRDTSGFKNVMKNNFANPFIAKVNASAAAGAENTLAIADNAEAIIVMSGDVDKTKVATMNNLAQTFRRAGQGPVQAGVNAAHTYDSGDPTLLAAADKRFTNKVNRLRGLSVRGSGSGQYLHVPVNGSKRWQ